MGKITISSSEIDKLLEADPEYKKENDRLQTRYNLIAQIINARHEQKITQAEIAERMGTKKSNICRFESGSYNPSLDFLIKAAASLGKRIKLSLY